jgi:hypothetical protein
MMRRLAFSMNRLSVITTMLLLFPALGWGLTPVRTKVGDQYRVTNSSRFKGWSEVPSADGKESTKGEFAGASRVVFRERQLAPSEKEPAARLFRVYDAVEYTRTMGAKEEKARLRQQVRRVLLDPLGKGFVIYSPDGPLRLAELSMLSDHSHLPQLETFLPEKELQPGETWPADPQALSELTGLDQIESGSVECKFEGEVTIQGAPFAQISATGNFVGQTGPQKSRCQLRAGLYLDPKTGRFISMRAVGKQETLGLDDKVAGEVQVDFQVLVEASPQDGDLADEAVAKLPQTSTPELLQLVFELPERGFRMTHSRQWILQRVDADRFFFAGPNVSFVVTLEPDGKVPTAAAYQEQVASYMTEQKIETKQTIPVDSKELAGGSLSHFQYEAKIKDRVSLLDYWVRQVGDRGITVASNGARPVAEELLADLERIVTGAEFFEPVPVPPASPASEPPAAPTP